MSARSLPTKLICCACSAATLWAQTPQPAAAQGSIEPVRPIAPVVVRPYLAPKVPPIRLNDSGRLQSLVRANMLYLTLQDAIALVLENDIDLEIARYGPILAQWNLERAEAGGALPGVPGGASQSGTVASGQGVAGSQAAAGLSLAAPTGRGNGTNASISQVGTIAQATDPIVQQTSTFSHTTSPQFNTVQSGQQALVSATHVYTSSFQQGYDLGGSATLSLSEHYLKENAPTDFLNPSVAPSLSLSIRQNFLQGFWFAVNRQTIEVNKINLGVSDLNFRAQVENAVANVVTMYYALVSDYEDLRAKRAAEEAAQQFLGETRQKEQLGELAQLDVTLAESQLAASQADVIASLNTFEQQQWQLKNLFSRRGVLDPALATLEIVPLDRIVIPEKDDLAPLPDLIKEALANRPDIQIDQANLKSAEISTVATVNGLLPTLQVTATLSNSGLAGTRASDRVDPYFGGGFGTGLGEIFRRNFPTERISPVFVAQIYDRQAEADYGIDQLQLRQQQLLAHKTQAQVQVDVQNYVIALRQARARYQSASQNRVLQEKLYEGERQKFDLGTSTPYNVVVQQRDLEAARANEISAESNYINARIALDQALGLTLAANNVSINEAREGRVSRPSALPAALPPRP